MKCHPFHRLDRGLLHIAEFFFGPRESWKWWQRKLRKGLVCSVNKDRSPRRDL